MIECYYCGDNSHCQQKVETGLVLAIVKHVAQVHQVAIHLQSAENQGDNV